MCPFRSLSSSVFVLASFNCSFGQLHSGSYINFDTVNHLDLLMNSDRSILRVVLSAGFWAMFPLTRLGAFQRFCNYMSQKKLRISVSIEALLCCRSTYAPKTAACSFNLVIVLVSLISSTMMNLYSSVVVCTIL